MILDRSLTVSKSTLRVSEPVKLGSLGTFGLW